MDGNLFLDGVEVGEVEIEGIPDGDAWLFQCSNPDCMEIVSVRSGSHLRVPEDAVLPPCPYCGWGLEDDVLVPIEGEFRRVGMVPARRFAVHEGGKKE